jgi:hypothetical protein
MKVIALGDCGLLDSNFVNTAVHIGALEKLTIADCDLGAAPPYGKSLRIPLTDAVQTAVMNIGSRNQWNGRVAHATRAQPTKLGSSLILAIIFQLRSKTRT